MATKPATSSPAADLPGDKRWSKKRVAYVAVFCVAAASSVALGILALEESGLKKAERAFESGNHAVARLEVLHYLEKHPDHGRAQTLYAQILVATGQKPKTALEIFEKYQAATPEEMHAWARAYFLTEQWSAAIPLMENVIEKRPNDMDALQELLTARLRIRQFERALPEAEKFAKSQGREARGNVYLGAIYRELDNSEKACEHFAKVLEYEETAENLQIPAHEFFAYYAQSLLLQGQAEEARKNAERSLSFERTPPAYNVLGEALQQLGEADLAVKAWRSCVVMDAENVEARKRLAQQALANKQPQDALVWMDRVAKSPNISAENAYLLERCYRALKDDANAKIWSEKAKQLRELEKARAQLRNYAVEYPDSFIAMVFLAWEFAERGNWGQARSVLSSQALRKDTFESDFVAQLADAVEEQSAEKLPPLESFKFPE